jgi:hypothetical protein
MKIIIFITFFFVIGYMIGHFRGWLAGFEKCSQIVDEHFDRKINK